MKTNIIALLALTVTLASAAIPVAAQSGGQYDPSMEKHADQRVAYVKTQEQAANAASQKHHAAAIRLHKAKAGKAAKGQASVEAESADRTRMVDFMSLCTKRADLRLRVSQAGESQAYSEWLAER